MKVKELVLKNFKRFTDLTIKDIPESAKLVVLVGSNGCGKSSLFEGLLKAYKTKTSEIQVAHYQNDDYIKKDNKSSVGAILELWQDLPSAQNNRFYKRTSYRYQAEFTVNSLSKVEYKEDPYNYTFNRLEGDTISKNFQKIISKSLEALYDKNNDTHTTKDTREKIIGKVRESIGNIFPYLQLNSIGDPLQDGSFYFSKGSIPQFSYKNLSAGEKSAFDLILDLVLHINYYPDALFCIDEPESHMHTELQATLLREIYRLIPGNSQLWIATHSLGMLHEAQNIEKKHLGTVVFLNMDDQEYDSSVILAPSLPDRTLLDKFLELTMGSLSSLVAPEYMVFCEGTTQGNVRKDFDASIYEVIFKDKRVKFISAGACTEVVKDDNPIYRISSLVGSKTIKLLDRDARNEQEVQDLETRGFKVLSKRHLESYIFTDEIVSKFCESLNKLDKKDDCLKAIKDKLTASKSRGNAPDDLKSASGEIYNEFKRILDLTASGSSSDIFLRDSLAPLITPDTETYKQLEKEIFG